MPHFGLMDKGKMSSEEAALLRARLHIRGGRRRLAEGKTGDALAVLYDALGHGLKYYAKHHGLEVETEKDDNELYHIEHAIARQLVQAGVLDDLDFITWFIHLADKAVAGTVPEVNSGELLDGLDEIMVQLGVMPFSESELPPEDPDTF